MRNRTLGFAMVLGLLWCASGCGSAPPTPSASAVDAKATGATNEVAKASAEAQTATTTTKPMPVAQTQGPALPDQKPPLDKAAPKAETNTTAAMPDDPKGPSANAETGEKDDPNERLVLFTTRGPLVVQLRLRVDGRALSAWRTEQIAEMLRLADADKDGRTTWPETLGSAWFAAGGMTPRTMDDRERTRLAKLYDRNFDGLADPAEAARYVAATPGLGAGLTLTDSSPLGDGAQSPLWKAIDANDDRVLDAGELAAAFTQLKSRDADDDDLLTRDELAPTPVDQSNPERMARDQTPGAPWAMMLGDRARWDSLVYAFASAYQEDDRLAVERFPLAQPLLVLDKNGDGELDRKEVRGLSDAAGSGLPPLVLEVRFGRAAPSPEARAVLVHESIGATEWTAAAGEARAGLVLAALGVEFRFRDPLAAAPWETLAKTQFTALDMNSNGYLEAEELPENNGQTPLSFAALDADSDGKVYPAEFEAYASKLLSMSAARISARPTGGDDPLWSLVDLNADSRLSLRELQAAGQALARCDTDGDGQITPGELPRRQVLWIERELPREAGALPAAMRAAPAPVAAAAGPAWFVKTDANGDGDVSHREFLGTAAQFTALDQNADGFIDPSEAERASGQTAAGAQEAAQR